MNSVLTWLPSILIAAAALIVSILTYRSRSRRELTTDIKIDTSERTELALLGWTLADRLALEKRLVTIEQELANQKELHDILERLMAKVLHSPHPHRAALDGLLEKVYDGKTLSDGEVMFLVDWLYEISTDDTLSKGEQTAAAILLAFVGSRYKHLMPKGSH